MKQWVKLSLVVTVMLCSIADSAYAQSNHRDKQASSHEASSPNSSPVTPEDSVAAGDTKNKLDPPKLYLRVVSYAPSGIIPAARKYMILDNFIQRLKETPFTVTMSVNEISRKEATELAHQEKNDYIVWVELQPDTRSSDQEGVSAVSFNDLIINYVILTPLTGQVKAQGRIYYQHLYERSIAVGSNAKIPPQRPFPARIPAENTPARAGREAASRVVEGLN